MFNVRPTRTTEFKEGDNVVLAEGTYQGTPGVFIRLRQDINWAEILERSGAMRCHPVVWLQPADPPGNTVLTRTCVPRPLLERCHGVPIDVFSGVGRALERTGKSGKEQG